jgi:hypothetical protein
VTTIPRAGLAIPYLDVACELVRTSDGSHRVILSISSWSGAGGDLSTHADFASEDDALEAVTSAILLFRLRKSPGRDRWQNAPSPGLRRATWRVAGRLRRRRARSSP